MKNCPKCGYSLNDEEVACPKCQKLHREATSDAIGGSIKRQNSTSFSKGVGLFFTLSIVLWILYHLGAFADLKSAVIIPTPQTMYQTFTVGYWTYRVDAVRRERALGTGAFSEKADGQFVIVFLTVQNDDSTASTLPPPILLDGMGREHSNKAAIGSGLPGDDLTIATLNPGVSKKGYFIFDVPPDVSGLKLQLKGGYKTGDRAVVPLN